MDNNSIGESMGYIKSKNIPKKVYHFTKKENVKSILRDCKIIPADGLECWFSLSLEDLYQYMKLTVMNEGGAYVGADFAVHTYPKFNPEEYVILELKPRYTKDKWYYYVPDSLDKYSYEDQSKHKLLSKIKIGYRGDMEFKKSAKIIEMTNFLDNLK